MERVSPGRFSLVFSMVALCAVVVVTPHARAQTGGWIEIQDLPTIRAYASGSAAHGKVYVFGGVNWLGLMGERIYQTLATVEEFDPATGTWTRRQNMPSPTYAPSAIEIDGTIYVIGGQNPFDGVSLASTYAFEPLTDTWTRLADMPTARAGVTAVLFDHKIYAIGGAIGRADRPTVLSTVEVYDPATDAWVRAADMPTARGLFTADVLDGTIVTMGGTNDNSGVGLTTVEIYYPASDTWSKGSDLPRARWAHGSAMFDGRLYLFGGAGGGVGAYAEIDVYETGAGIWTSASPMTRPRRAFASAIVSGSVYVVGGIAGGAGAPAVSTADVFEIGGATSSENPGTFSQSALEDAYPNPFDRRTTITFSLAGPSYVTVEVFDLVGRRVASLIRTDLPPGAHSVAWEASGTTPGVYVYRLVENTRSTGGVLHLVR